MFSPLGLSLAQEAEEKTSRGSRPPLEAEGSRWASAGRLSGAGRGP